MAEPIRHGGNLREAAKQYGIALGDWLDLSTGINPRAYPVPAVPVDAWRRLPEDADGFAELAAKHYGAPGALPVAGSQAAIRTLPGLLQKGVAAVAPLTYGEYTPAFERAGHRVVPLDVTSVTLPEDVDHVIVANPDNPTTTYLDRDVLLGWHEQLAAREGTLIIDEAFADAYDNASLAPETYREGLIVLRSVGKFYGLAGIRAGFVLAAQPLRNALNETLGAWTVSGPARHAVSAAFNDRAWQMETRATLARESARLSALIRSLGFKPYSTPLFAWFQTPTAANLQRALAEKGIWTRLFEHGVSPSLRIGLTGSEDEWSRFSQAFEQVAGEQ
ncbi:threonine-phosphate decarboxylase [Burkholderia sp. Leaf177]|uniref:threonine-phosphate decarboxylase CobD n=1 Tax=Burkholderia sp. Leaf177 TaxID=1736287 RepID=UPI0006F20E59|nr:threonine-phosphate decarboxylase CobD [Burkholderia sp. Leaf177]KQR89882.1 threonine-phosphate decarboxylase [Burkholderia sp. Leaf177]